MKTKSIPSAAIALIFIFFFLPWVTVSCSGEEVVTLSGYDLSVGKEVGSYGEKTDADPLVFLVPIVALLAIGTLFIANKYVAGGGQIAAAAVGLGIMGLKWQLMFENDDPYVEIMTEYGAWGSLAGLLLLLAGGVLTLMITNSPPLSHASPPKPVAPLQQSPKPTVVAQPQYQPPPMQQQQPPPMQQQQPPPMQQQQPSQCPQCQTALRPGARFCPTCGHKM